MRLRVVRDGRSDEVEVAADLRSVTLHGRTFPVQVVKDSPLRVELEVGGERVVVENWPEHFAEPPAPVDLNGERSPVSVERLGGVGPPEAAPRPAAPGTPRPPDGPRPSRAGGGTPVTPPMPGKVIEVRVAEGARVRAGDVLLVLEAMKMRNEVTSPAAGVVRDLRVAPGANARAREPMMYIVAEHGEPS